jgi:hypothetical protein
MNNSHNLLCKVYIHNSPKAFTEIRQFYGADKTLPDCRTCRKRRIRCDRGFPTCHKCSTRNLTCPGYGSHYRWTNAIAVRGRFRGLQTPELSQTPAADNLLENRGSPSTSNSPIKDGPIPEKERMALDLSAELIPNFPSPDTVEHLLEHYDKKIAGLMVWVDGEHNAYRSLVLPLAKQQPVLLLAILAISSKHLAATSDIESNFSKSACDAALSLITQQVQKVTSKLAMGHDLGNEIDTATAEWMLASMLTLSSYEMVVPNAVAWQSHRQAARTLVNALSTTDRRHHSLYSFLRNQLSIYDILACTTNFDASDLDGIILPDTETWNVLFGDYLTLIHQMTLCSRRNPAQSRSGEETAFPQFPSFKDLRGRFELARGSTLMASGLLSIDEGPRRRDFIRLVDIYHHAGLLYSYRCLESSDVAYSETEYSYNRIFEAFEDLEEVSACIQNLPWPTFIAGAQCRKNEKRQESIVRLYQMIMQDMGFNHYSLVLQFLTTFWKGGEDNWFKAGCEWEKQGYRLLAV